MTEQQQTPPTQTATPTAQPTSAPVQQRAKTEPTEARFCVYDDTLLKFVGPVHDTKKKAQEFAKGLPKGRKYEVREV